MSEVGVRSRKVLDAAELRKCGQFRNSVLSVVALMATCCLRGTLVAVGSFHRVWGQGKPRIVHMSQLSERSTGN